MGHRFRGGSDPAAEGGWAEDFGVLTPAENPILQVGSGGDVDGEVGGAVAAVVNLLAGVPLAFGGEAGGESVEADGDFLDLGGLEGGETPGKHLADREVGGACERIAGGGDVAEAGDGKGAQGIANDVVADEIPLVGEATEVVGADVAAGGGGAGESGVVEGDGAAVEDGFGEGLEGVEFGDGDALRAEGNGIGELVQRDAALAFEAGGEFGKSGSEGLLEGGAPVLFDGFLRDEEGDELAVAHLNGGKTGDGFGVMEAVGDSVVGDGKAELVAHEVDVALDRFGRDGHRAGETLAIWESSVAEEVVDAEHAGQRGAGGSFGNFFWDSLRFFRHGTADVLCPLLGSVHYEKPISSFESPSSGHCRVPATGASPLRPGTHQAGINLPPSSPEAPAAGCDAVAAGPEPP